MNKVGSADIPITGIGVINPVATNAADFSDALRAAVPNLSQLQTSPIPRGKSTVGLVTNPQFDGVHKGLAMAIAAVTEALSLSGLDVHEEDNIGVFLATMSGDSHVAENLYSGLTDMATSNQADQKKLTEAVKVFPNGALLRKLCRHFDFRGPQLVISNACASGNIAVGLALDYLRTKKCSAVVVVGVEVMKVSMLWGAERAGFVGDTLRPFHAQRNGAILGEGAASVILVAPEKATPNRIIGWVNGFGSVCDRGAAPITLAEDGSGLLRAMKLALQDAEKESLDLEYVNAHAPGTRMIDAIECKAISELCASHANNIVINATKSITTHLSGASALTEIVATLLQMRDGFVHGNASLDQVDPALALDPVGPVTIQRKVSFGLSNACGGGGLNSSIALSSAASCVAGQRTVQTESAGKLVITGVGTVVDKRFSWRPMGEAANQFPGGPLDGFDIYQHYPSTSNYHYMNRAAQLAAAASALALGDAGIKAGELPYADDRLAVVFGTCLGGAPEASKVMCDGLFSNPKAITPSMSLDHGIHLGAALVCRHYGLTGTSYTLTGSCRAGLQALEVAALSIQTGRAAAALVAGYDAYNDFQASLVAKFNIGGPTVDSAVAAVLETTSSACKRNAPILAQLSDITTLSGKYGSSRERDKLIGKLKKCLSTNEWDLLYLATSEPWKFQSLIDGIMDDQSDRACCLLPGQGLPDQLAGLGMAALIDAIDRGKSAAIIAPEVDGNIITLIVGPVN
jgi:3-oxoacyl-[acyl-carrier-protein] synthase II